MDLFGHVNYKYSSNKLYSVEKWKYITALFTNMRTLKFKSRLQLRFSLPSIIITITSNET